MLSSTFLRPTAPATASPTHPVTGASTSRSAPSRRRASAAVALAVRNYDLIPKREPFSSSRSVLEQFLRQEKPFVQRTKDQVTDYCTTIEGDECCSCWDAYFELNELEVEDIHQALEAMRTQYLNDWRRWGDWNDPFVEAETTESTKQEAAVRIVHPTLHLSPPSQPKTPVTESVVASQLQQS